MEFSNEPVSYKIKLLNNHKDQMERICLGNSDVIAWLIAEAITYTEEKLEHYLDLNNADHILAEILNLIVNKSSKCDLKTYSNFCLTAKNRYMKVAVKGLGGNRKN